MPSLIDIRRRIRSVKNMQQITKAMKMVSAAKLRRAQDRTIAARPYGEILNRMLANVAAAAASNEEAAQHPLLAVREEKRVQLVMVTSDTGLAGAFNANVLRLAQRFVDENTDKEVRIEALGRKGRDYFRRRKANLTGEHVGIVDRPKYEDARSIADQLIKRYSNAEIDAVYLCVNEFKNVMSPNVILRRILPVEPAGIGPDNRLHLRAAAQRVACVSFASLCGGAVYSVPCSNRTRAYHAARMTAMDAASSNAGDMIDSLTLNMNRVRQAKITREIIEIVSGAAAAM